MSALPDVMRELASAVGERHFLTATDAVSKYRVDGQQPAAVCFPGSAEEVAEVLRAASQANLSVLLRGAGRHMHLGAVPGAIGLVVSLARLDAVVEYDAENLTVTAEAGLTLERLQEVVGERGQMLPLDQPGPPSATLGGILSANLAGPLRMRWGAPRDLAIGLRVALADGSTVKTGGKTVKNVAGYDLTKLFIGSFGTLGAICEATVRLSPVPEVRAMMVAALEPTAAASTVRHLLHSRLEVSALDVANYQAARERLPSLPVTVRPEAWVVTVGLMGDRESTQRQEREIRGISDDGWARLDGPDAESIWEAVRDAGYPGQEGAVVARLHLPMARVGEALELTSSRDGWWGLARAGDGLVYAGPPSYGEAADVEDRLTALRDWAEEHDGFALLESGPVELKQEFPVWGEDSPNLELMRALKEGYDKGRRLGCGRYLPGL
jgi:glycolate oxidase FAD binding subunit